jgi:hypothetical protein
MEVLLSLVDATGTAIPASDASNTGVVHGLGVHVVTDQQIDLELSTQAELTETTYYRVVVRQGRDEWRRDVQIPAGDGSPLTWAQFLAFADPVTAGLAWANRLLPTGATDRQVATYDAATGLWVPEDQSGGGGGVSEDEENLLTVGTDDLPFVSKSTVVTPSDHQTISVKTILNSGETAYNLGASISGTLTVDLANGHTQYGTLSGNVTAFAITNGSAHAATAFTLVLTKSTESIVWASGLAYWLDAAPDLSAAGTYLLDFRLVNGSWYGIFGGARVAV